MSSVSYPITCRQEGIRPLRPIKIPPPVPLVPTVQRPLTQQEWYHGQISRQDVESLLLKNGDFLVRASCGQPGEYVLSVMAGGQCRHFIIQRFNGIYHLKPGGPTFPTIQLLIAHHLTTHEVLTSKSEVFLKNPIRKVRWLLDHEDVLLGELLSSGNFGHVYSGRLVYNNIPVAVKMCKDSLPPEIKNKFLTEARILRQYDHPNIVKLIGVCAWKEPVYIIMELVAGGDFQTFLRREGSRLCIKEQLIFAEQVAAGMAYLESKHCIHRDLAARNVLVGERNTLKISDFGLSRQEEDGVYTSRGGIKQIPIKWTAPEAIKYGRFSTSSDVWSYGILLWEIFTFGATPYTGMSNQQTVAQVAQGYRMRMPDYCHMDLYDLMVRCWDEDPNLRPSFSQILQEVSQLNRYHS